MLLVIKYDNKILLIFKLKLFFPKCYHCLYWEGWGSVALYRKYAVFVLKQIIKSYLSSTKQLLNSIIYVYVQIN